MGVHGFLAKVRYPAAQELPRCGARSPSETLTNTRWSPSCATSTRVHGRLHQWRRLSGMPTTAEAVHVAVQPGWVESVGGHGVALTDIGRQMVHHWERAKQVKRGLRVADKRARPYWGTAIATG